MALGKTNRELEEQERNDGRLPSSSTRALFRALRSDAGLMGDGDDLAGFLGIHEPYAPCSVDILWGAADEFRGMCGRRRTGIAWKAIRLISSSRVSRSVREMPRKGTGRDGRANPCREDVSAGIGQAQWVTVLISSVRSFGWSKVLEEFPTS